MTNASGVVIIIPARFGARRLPGKPLAELLGKPLVHWAHEIALKVPSAQRVVVATDDQRVVGAVEAFGGRAVMTSPQHDTGTERVAEIAADYPASLYVALPVDEPLVRPDDVEQLVQAMRAKPDVDVGTLCHSLPDDAAGDANAVKLVRDAAGETLYCSRLPIPYAQDAGQHPGYLRQTGVYVFRREALAGYAALPVSPQAQAEQCDALRWLAADVGVMALPVEPMGPCVATPACLEKVAAVLSGGADACASAPDLARVRLLITDVDGVLTDGGIYYDASGECLKRFHVRDGLGIRLLEESGIRVAVLSGRDSPTLRKRLADLGVSLFQLGAKDKAAACHSLMEQAGVSAEETACIGDDSIDLPAFATCGVSYAVADAPLYVKARASAVLSTAGGQGALRELADAILAAKGKADVYASAAGFQSVSSGAAQ